MNEGTHKAFLGRLDKSKIGVAVVAFWFLSKGYKVMLKPSTRAEKRKDWQDHSDEGDLFIYKEGKGAQAIEVKRLGVNFTNADDFPYRPNYFVDSVGTFNRKREKPNAYCVLSGDMRCMGVLIIRDGDEKNWGISKKIDSNTKEMTEFYVVNVNSITFKRLDKL